MRQIIASRQIQKVFGCYTHLNFIALDVINNESNMFASSEYLIKEIHLILDPFYLFPPQVCKTLKK
jgi:hypothetical protein